jgi:lysophospholipid acyltransferase (LPLAT)-like uncharacterized protein
MVVHTLRFEYILEPGAQTAFDYPRPSIFIFWHRAILGAAAHFRDQRIAILISRSFDGELIARTTQHLGFLPVRGSSTRGGAAGLGGLQQSFADGSLCAITVDGPGGPKYVAKPGAVQLAQLTRSAICPFYVLPQRAWVLTKSWDQFLIPKPFSRVVVTYPTPVEFNSDPAVMQAAVQSALDRSVALAEHHWSAQQ